jgi:ubiquinone biosynthesis protein
MLNRKLIPTPLIPTANRAPIRIRQQPPRAHFRTAYLVVHVLWLLARIFWFRALRGLTDDRLGNLLRDFCERMGVLWIKLGQLLSMRADLAPLGVRAQLAKLLDQVEGFPAETAVRLIEAELGGPLDRYFSAFDRTCLAAASIGQVHKARLRQGGWVVIKVRRPDVLQICARDMAFVHFVVRCLEWLRFKPQGRWAEMVWELQEVMLEELDYRFEATNLRRMKKNLRRHGIYVPRVFGRYSSSSILVMELIQGVLMSDYLQAARLDPLGLVGWREANNVEPAKVARRLVHSLFRQTFEENLFHGDLHPGNIVLLRDSRVAFLDFGSLGSMERDLTRNVDLYLQALGARQYSKMVDISFLFSPSLPLDSLAECKNEMVRRLQAWDLRCRVPGLPYTEKSFNAIQDELMLFASAYGVAPVWTFLRMTRAMTTMDASLRELIPESDFHALVNSYYRGRVGRIRRQLLARLRERGRILRDWFELQGRLLDDMRFRSGIVRRAALVFEHTSSKITLFFSRIFAQLAALLLVIGLLLLLTLLLQQDRARLGFLPAWAIAALDHVPHLDAQVWGLVFALLFYARNRIALLSRRFRVQDVEAGDR